MKKTTNWIEKRQLLRTHAEGMVAPFSAPKTGADPLDLLCHELMVHKVELEMQVEELRRANLQLQELGDQYQARYALGPAASFSVDAKGRITDANAAGARLLGLASEQLVNQPFAKFTAGAADADRWHLLHKQRMQAPEGDQGPFVLAMARADGQPLQVFCRTSTLLRDAGGTQLQLVLFDLAELQQAQA